MKEKKDKYFLKGVMQKFPRDTSGGRIYPNKLYESILYETKIRQRKEKIKNLLDYYDKEGN